MRLTHVKVKIVQINHNNVDDALSLSEKVKLIGLFQKDAIAAQTYLDLVHDDVHQAWLCTLLDDN